MDWMALSLALACMAVGYAARWVQDAFTTPAPRERLVFVDRPMQPRGAGGRFVKREGV